MDKHSKLPLILILLFAAAILLYLPLAARTVQESDGGELATAAYTGSVVHPPGYPLFMVAAQGFVQLTALPPYYAVSTLAGIFQALALAGLFAITFQLTRNYLSSFAVSLSWGFYDAVLRTGADAEVFSLHHLFVVALVLVTFRISETKQSSLFSLFFVGLLSGIAASHHQTIVLWAPLVASVVWKRGGGTLSQFLVGFSITTVGAVLGLFPYLLLPLFSGDPLVFLPPGSGRELLHYVFRTAYGTFSLSTADPSSTVSYFGYLLKTLAVQAPILLLGVPLLGLTLHRHRDPVIFGTLGSLLLHLWFANHLLFPPDTDLHGEFALRFFALVALSLAIALAVALQYFMPSKIPYLLTLAALVPLTITGRERLVAANNSLDRTVHYELETIFSELPADAVFFAGLDRIAMGLLYKQRVEGVREDVLVVVPTMLRNKDYIRLLRRHIPDSIEFSPAHVTHYFRTEGRRVFSYYETPVPEGFGRWPIGISWEWLPIDKQTPNETEVRETLLRFCLRWPDGLLSLSRHRHHSRMIVERVFVAPLAIELRRWAYQDPENASLLSDFHSAFLSNDTLNVRDVCRQALSRSW